MRDLYVQHCNVFDLKKKDLDDNFVNDLTGKKTIKMYKKKIMFFYVLLFPKHIKIFNVTSISEHHLNKSFR